MKALNEEEILELAKQIKELADSLNQENLLDVVKVNENVHSRILRLLFQYHIDGKYPLYELFLENHRIQEILPVGFEAGTPIFYNERDRIDLLIEGKDYAIIIENKIYWAVDQDGQLERYLESCIARSLAPQNLYAIYLTEDGTKKVSSCSLTEKAKDILGINGGLKGRFVEMSFKYDILPWLNLAITKTDTETDAKIHAALLQYEDYLNRIIGEGTKDSQYNQEIENTFKKMGIDSIASYNNCIDATELLSDVLRRKRDELCKTMADKYVTTPLSEYCKSKGVSLDVKNTDYTYKFIQVRIPIPGLSNASFSIHTESDGRNIYGIANDYRGSYCLSEEAFAHFIRRDSRFNKTEWWPAYKYPNKDTNDRRFIYTATPEFWEQVVCGGELLEFLKKSYEEVVLLFRKG